MGMPRVLVALASVGLRASSFTLTSQRRLPFRRTMGTTFSSASADEQELRSILKTFSEDKTGE
jgi:hypothetical protein